MNHRIVAAVLILGVLSMPARTDEGMWLLNDPPRELLKTKYQFEFSDAWLDRAMKANVRFNSGGSGGFVSSNGLIVTNHHIAADALQKLSTAKKDLYRDGFLAKAQTEELRCPDLELNVLQSIENVTDRVNAAVKTALKPEEAAAARRAILSEIEKESLAKTGLRSDVVMLYQGGAYHLYRYKKYTDVRLVFAPEAGIAGFGGDVDNFEYPRHGLDVAFFRAYENGQPAKTPDYFRWSKTGPSENDLLFVTGHPGATQRLETLARLKHRRDYSLPYVLARVRALEGALLQFSERGIEEHRQAANNVHRVANARKAFSGQLQGLLDPAIMKQKEMQERELIASTPLVTFPQGRDHFIHWKTIEDIQKKYREFEVEHAMLESGDAFYIEPFTIARHCVRMAEELEKPSSERLREYRDSNLESLKFQLFSPAPLYPALERTKLQTSLTFMAEQLGGEHKLVTLVLAGQNPAARATALIKEIKLFEVAERKKLVDGGMKAILASKDPMILLARSIDQDSRLLRKRFEVEVEEPERAAYGEIAKLRFQAYGKTIAPDATFTLRIAFGTVRGYEVDGEDLPFHTTFGSAFARAKALNNREPFELPERWLKGESKLDLSTPFNFVSTADTIGGNSGSPVLNRAGELVGINFDRNRHGLVRNFVYTDVQARHISVHCRAVIEALTKLYDAKAIVSELNSN